MKITEEMVEKADNAYRSAFLPRHRDLLRVALEAVLPDIEREVREECAKVVDIHGGGRTPARLARLIRALK